MTRPSARRVVLTGGIGSGKSAAGQLLASWGATLVDADELAREVVAPGTPGLAAVVAAFGPEVLTPWGALDRAAVADLVFADGSKLAALEAIIHPLVARAAQDRFAAAPEGAVTVYEVPVIHPGQAPDGDVVLVVDAPDDVRRTRLLSRGLSEEQITARMAQQPTRAEWLALADHVIDNSGDLATLAQRLRAVWVAIGGPGRHGTTDPAAVGGAD